MCILNLICVRWSSVVTTETKGAEGLVIYIRTRGTEIKAQNISTAGEIF